MKTITSMTLGPSHPSVPRWTRGGGAGAAPQAFPGLQAGIALTWWDILVMVWGRLSSCGALTTDGRAASEASGV